MSASILELLGDEHIITNASWLQTGQQSKPLPTSALGSNVLCQRHNGLLSDLDTNAKFFCKELLNALSKDGHIPYSRVTVDGDLFERWVLKVCCGAFASGTLAEKGHKLVREPPLSWLNILFGKTSWAQDTGLFIRQTHMTPHLGYAIGPVYVKDVCVGGGIEFAGIEFFVLIDSGAKMEILEPATGEISPLVYRPGVIKVESQTRVAEIELTWRNRMPTNGILYRSL